LKSLEQRLRALEDRNGIEELRATYCFLVDDGKFDELVERCFTDDARCDFRDARGAIAPLVSTGHTEIRAFFGQVVAALLGDMSHTVHNHRIVVDGDTARGECYFELTATSPATNEAVVGAGRYLDRYRRVDGVWRFAERVAVIGHMAPLAEGWVRQRLLRALTGA
jgi:ketosteroid isomerase-like protein